MISLKNQNPAGSVSLKRRQSKTLNLDEINKLIFVPSKLQKNKNTKSNNIELKYPAILPLIYNKDYTFTISTDDYGTILTKIENALKEYGYNNDIEYNTDNIKYEIKGNTYINNKHASFIIRIYINNGNIYINFNKLNGNDYVFNTFYNDIKSKIFVERNSNSNDFFSLNELEIHNEYNYDDIIDFYIDIKNDDNINSILQIIINELNKKSNNVFVKLLINNKELINELILKLKHNDINTVRMCLVIFSILIKIQKRKYKKQLIYQYKILKYIKPLKKHKSKLVRKYVNIILKSK